MTMLTEDTGEHDLLFFEEDVDAITYGRHSACEAKPETLMTHYGAHWEEHFFSASERPAEPVTVADLVRRLDEERGPLTFEEKVTALGQEFDELDEPTGVLLTPYRPGRHAPEVDPEATVGFMPISTTTRRAGGPIRRGRLLVVGHEDAAVAAMRRRGETIVGDMEAIQKEVFEIRDAVIARHTPQPNPWQRFKARVKKIRSQWT